MISKARQLLAAPTAAQPHKFGLLCIIEKASVFPIKEKYAHPETQRIMSRADYLSEWREVRR
jgi:hypothetical protein